MKAVIHKLNVIMLALFLVSGFSLGGLTPSTAQAATDSCPNGGTLNSATASCEYPATSTPTQYCANGGTQDTSGDCVYDASDPTCDTAGYTFDPFASSTACLSPTPTGDANYDCNSPNYYTNQGPGGPGCYLTEAVAVSELCPTGGSYNVSSTPWCSSPLSTTNVYSCNNDDTRVNTTCSYQAIVGTMTDSQPSQSLTVPNGSNITVDGSRGTTLVQSGATLKGVGIVGVLTVNSGGTVAPGHSPGVLQSGNLTLNGTYEFELGGTTPGEGNGYHDQIDVTGSVDVSGATLVASLYGGFVPTAGQAFTIINNDGSDAVTGTFNGLTEGASYVNQGVTYTVSYVGGTGNDVTLTVAAVDPASLPSVPNTGLAMLRSNPLIVLVASVVTAGMLIVLGRKVRA